MPISQKPRNNRPLILGAGLVVVLALIAFFATRGDDTRGDAGASSGGERVEEVGSVQVEGQPLAELNPAGEDPAVDRMAPSLEGTSFDGSAISIQPGSEPKLVIFVAHCARTASGKYPRL